MSPRPSLYNHLGQAGGNDALALLLTVTTNLLGVVTVPFFVKGVVRAGNDAEIDALDLLVKLVRRGGKEGRVATGRVRRVGSARLSGCLVTRSACFVRG